MRTLATDDAGFIGHHLVCSLLERSERVTAIDDFSISEVSRDFTHVAKVIQANLLAAWAPIASGPTCNVASGSRSTLLDLLEAICTAVRRRVVPILGPPRAGDVRGLLADIAFATTRLAYAVLVPFRESLARKVEWRRDQAAGPANRPSPGSDLPS